jgi:hypothetical protein
MEAVERLTADDVLLSAEETGRYISGRSALAVVVVR